MFPPEKNALIWRSVATLLVVVLPAESLKSLNNKLIYDCKSLDLSVVLPQSSETHLKLSQELLQKIFFTTVIPFNETVSLEMRTYELSHKHVK